MAGRAHPSDRPTRALVVGRFQPPHRGHLACIAAAQGAADEVVVAVGSAQRSHTVRDPFTAGERIEMLRLATDEGGIPVASVVPIPDLDQYHLWVAQVRAYVPAFDLAVTGSPMTAHLFEQAGVPVRRIEVEERGRWSGTAVRRHLLRGEPAAEALTPAVARFLDRPHLRDRLTALARAEEGQHG